MKPRIIQKTCLTTDDTDLHGLKNRIFNQFRGDAKDTKGSAVNKHINKSPFARFAPLREHSFSNPWKSLKSVVPAFGFGSPIHHSSFSIHHCLLVLLLCLAGHNAWAFDTTGENMTPAGGVVEYDNLEDFQAAAGPLVAEDFEGGFPPNLPNGNTCPGVLNSETDNVCFAPGDLISGFTARASSSGMYLFPPGQCGGKRCVSNQSGSARLIVDFDQAVTALGLDLRRLTGSVTVEVQAFDAGDQMIHSTVVPGTSFVGFVSDTPIARVEALNTSGSAQRQLRWLYFSTDDPVLAVAPSSLDFGPVEVNTSAGPLTTTLSSVGAEPLQVTAIDGANAPFARTGGDCPAVPFQLPVGDQCMLEYGFSPTVDGSFSQALAITSDSAMGSETLTLLGEGFLVPAIELDPEVLSATLPIGGSELQSLNIANTGDVDLSWWIGACSGGDLVLEHQDFESFEQAAGPIVSEDFEGGPTAPTASPQCPGSFNSETDNVCFAPGNLIEGFSVFASDSGPMRVTGADVSPPRPGTTVGASQYTAWTVVEFDPPVQAAAISFFRRNLSAGNVAIVLRDPLGAEIESLTVTLPAGEGGFRGFVSERAIGRIEVDSGLVGASAIEKLGELHFSAAGAALPPWLVLTPMSGIVAPDAEAEVSVTFDADGLASGLYEEELCVHSNDPHRPEVPLPVSLTVMPVVEPVLSVAPETLNFGQVQVGDSAGPLTVTLSSIGNGPVQVTAIDEAAAPFARTGGDCPVTPFPLPVDDSCTLEYGFVPTTGGSFNQTLAITSDGGNATIEMQGQGVATIPELAIDPAELDFGQVEVGTTAGPQNITLSSTGSGPVEITAIDPANAPFTLSGGTCEEPPFTLDPSESCTLDYEFAPTAEGSFDLTIHITSNADPVSFDLAGEGFDPPSGPPQIEVSPESIELSVSQGGTGSQALLLSNTGGEALDWSIGSVGTLGAGDVQGGLDVYTSPAGFLAAAGPVVMEDWTGGAVGPGEAMNCGANILNSQSNNACFSPGDLIEGFSVFLSNSSNISALGAGFEHADFPAAVGGGGAASVATIVEFDPPVGAAAVEFFRRTTSAVNDFEVIVRDAGGDIMETFMVPWVASGNTIFRGFISDQSIGSISVRGLGTGVSAHERIGPLFFGPPVTVRSGEFPSWLSVDPATGTLAPAGSTSVSVDVDAGALAPGEYDAELCIQSNDPDRPEVRVPVALTVTPVDHPPQIAVDPDSLSVFLPVDGADSETLTIANLGDPPLSWAVSEETFGGWVAQDSGVGGALAGISFINAHRGIAVGPAAGSGRRTEDGGQTWLFAPIRGGAVSMASEMVAIAIYNEVSYTTDGGQTWQGTNLGVPLFGVSMASEQVAMAVGVGGAIRYTQNGGQTWSFQDSGTTHDLWEVSMASEQIAVAVGADGTILRTADGGKTWQAENLGGGTLRDVSMAGAQVATAVGADGRILRTEDGGKTWEVQNSGTDAFLFSVSMASEDVAIAVGSVGTILRTEDGGQTWTQEDSGITSYSLNDVSFVDADTGWAVGALGDILHRSRLIECALPDWVTVVPTAGSIPGGDDQAVQVSFDAAGLTVGGVYRATLCLTSNDLDNPLLEVPLTLNVTGAPTPDLVVEPDELDFGAIGAGDSTAPQSVTLSSQGAAAVEITDITLAAAPFQHSGGTCPAMPFELAFGTSCTLTYVFAPTEAGAFDQTITVTGNADPVAFDLVGQGLGVPALLVVPAILDFGAIDVGDSAGPQSVTLSSTGTAPAQIDAIDTATAPFERNGGDCPATPFTLPQGDSCTLDYTFAPTAGGQFSQALAITGDADPAGFTLQGEGVPARIHIDPETITLELEIGDNAGETLLIGNIGGGPLAWSIDTAEPAANAPLSGLSGLIGAGLVEDFDDIGPLPDAGWAMINHSQPLGGTGWFQGTPAAPGFPAHQGDPDSYIAANFQNTGSTGTISNWLLTPEMVLVEGAELSFWTRAATGNFPDRLQVRLSTAGDSTEVGEGALDTGDFDVLLLEINPNLQQGGYPTDWTEYVVELQGIPSGVATGRIAFRYFVTDAGSSGSNGTHIGIDTVRYEPGCGIPAGIGWLEVHPPAGNVAAGDTDEVQVILDATGLSAGDYSALLCISSNDPDRPLVTLPIWLQVSGDPEPPVDGIFHDRFETGEE